MRQKAEVKNYRDFKKINYLWIILGGICFVFLVALISFLITRIELKKRSKLIYINWNTELYNRGNVSIELHMKGDLARDSQTDEVNVIAHLMYMRLGTKKDEPSEWKSSYIKYLNINAEVDNFGIVPLITYYERSLSSKYTSDASRNIAMKKDGKTYKCGVNKVRDFYISYLYKGEEKFKEPTEVKYQFAEKHFFYFSDLKEKKEDYNNNSFLEANGEKIFTFLISRKHLTAEESKEKHLTAEERDNYNFGLRLSDNEKYIEKNRHISYQLWLEREDGTMDPFYGVYGLRPNTLQKEARENFLVKTDNYVVLKSRKYSKIYCRLVYNKEGEEQKILRFSYDIKSLPNTLA